MNSCPNCGGTIEGDGYTIVYHCESIEAPNVEPDSDPVYCKELPELENAEADESKLVKRFSLEKSLQQRIKLSIGMLDGLRAVLELMALDLNLSKSRHLFYRRVKMMITELENEKCQN